MKKIYVVLIVWFVIVRGLKAQQELTLYNMQAVPQAMYVNPGAMPLTKINIGLPGISSNYLNYSNNGFTFHDMIQRDDNGGVLVDADGFMKKLKKNNNINLNAHIDLLSFGFKVKKKNYFSFNLTERVDVRMKYTKDFFSFLIYGNGAAANLDRDMKIAMGINASHYREWGLNYTREVNDKWTIGGRLKYLSGIENVNTEGTQATLNTNSQYYALTGSANVQVHSSGVDSTSQQHMNSILGFNPSRKNNGAAIDIGATYKFNDKLTFTGSIVDLGFITWKDYITGYSSNSPNATVHYNGVNINQAFNDTANFGNSVQKYGDSLSNVFSIKQNSNLYTTMLTTQIYLGANYWLNEKNNVAFLFNGRYAYRQLQPAFSLSFNNKVGRWFSASLSYSILNRSYNNVGLGLAFTGPVQLYVVTDNILSAFIFDKYDFAKTDTNGNVTQQKSFMIPAYTKNINVRFGINITIGKTPKDKDKDGVPDKKDACPDIAGPVLFKGCPDKDNDSIPDKDDKCPDIKGLVVLQGCPDKDGDGITDAEDDCPDEKGLPQFKGCPDKDGDGIIDKEDECPDDAGLVQYLGCPDRDGDSIPDKYDNCPDVAGPLKYHGCPDKDGDGLIDKDDNCPDEAGPAENKGCPWPDTDGDGIIDKEDDCPTVAGVKEMKGCPPIKVEEQKIIEKAFSSLEFATGKDIIKAVSYPSLNELAKLMKQHAADWTLKLSGHTDNQGDAAKNMLLSEKRAKAVKKYLVAKGVKEDKIITEWFGQTQPVDTNDTPAGRQHNRRVEMKILFVK